MTYEVYIKKDYKPRIRSLARYPAARSRSRKRGLQLLLLAGISLIIFLQFSAPGYTFLQPEEPAPATGITKATDAVTASFKQVPPYSPPNDQEPEISTLFHPQHDEPESVAFVPEPEEAIEIEQTATPTPPVPEWQTIKVKRGDNLSLIFDRMRLSPQELYRIVSIGEETKILKHLKPDQELRFQIKDNRLAKLEYDVDLTNVLRVTRKGDKFSAETLSSELETRVAEASGIINHSLFLAAQRAGLSDNLTMQLVSLYGWDIDFVLDIRKNDYFHVIYEEHFKNGVKVRDGPILAAEFVNRNKPIRAVRYRHEDGHIDYYSADGYSMRKAFLRTPVDFRRISSGFSLGRRHPILNTIRAHRGVDYAARTGTPVKATGDGVIDFVGRKGGYGRVIALRHGSKYSTLYAHLSRYARGISSGKRVKQGQIIGYVGMSGLATGPHLHYEFRINGVHRNPLTVELPKALSVPDEELPHFKVQTRPLLAQLDALTGSTRLAEKASQPSSLVALKEVDEPAAPSKN